jgi:hypothetical protein
VLLAQFEHDREVHRQGVLAGCDRVSKYFSMRALLTIVRGRNDAVVFAEADDQSTCLHGTLA